MDRPDLRTVAAVAIVGLADLGFGVGLGFVALVTGLGLVGAA